MIPYIVSVCRRVCFICNRAVASQQSNRYYFTVALLSVQILPLIKSHTSLGARNPEGEKGRKQRDLGAELLRVLYCTGLV